MHVRISPYHRDGDLHVVGITRYGQLIFFQDDGQGVQPLDPGPVPYTSGETLEEFGLDNHRPGEVKLLLLLDRGLVEEHLVIYNQDPQEKPDEKQDVGEPIKADPGLSEREYWARLNASAEKHKENRRGRGSTAELSPFHRTLALVRQMLEGKWLKLPDGRRLAMADDFTLGFLMRNTTTQMDVLVGDLTLKQLCGLVIENDIVVVPALSQYTRSTSTSKRRP